MSKLLDPFSQFMILMEQSAAPMHAGTIELFQLPKKAPKDFVARVVDQLRAIPACAPFNQVLTGSVLKSWKVVDVNMQYHVRHIRLPAPGTVNQLMEWSENFYGALLNRSLPLWEMWVLEGIEGDRFAIAVKGHHALSDGQGGMRIFLDAFAIAQDDLRVRAPWGDNADSQVHSRPRHASIPAAKALPAAAAAAPPTLAGWLQHGLALWPLQGRPSRFNSKPTSVARRFGFCDLPLTIMKELARIHEVTINDLIVTVVDHAVHRYLAEAGDARRDPLVMLMPMSTRKEGSASTGGNQVTTVTARLGAPQANIGRRLEVIHKALLRGKNAASQLPKAAQFVYSALLAGVLPGLAQATSGLGARRTPFNLIISNISPPRSAHYIDSPLYLGGAEMQGLYIQPIIGNPLLNVTVASYNNQLNVGIGSVPGVIDRPMQLGQYIVEALELLAADQPTPTPAPAAKQRRPRTRAVPASI